MNMIPLPVGIMQALFTVSIYLEEIVKRVFCLFTNKNEEILGDQNIHSSGFGTYSGSVLYHMRDV